jgi:hypothetical protein
VKTKRIKYAIIKEALSSATDPDLETIFQKLLDGEGVLSEEYATNQTNTNMIQLVEFICYSANVLYNISSRNIQDESLDIVISYSSVVDTFMNQSLDVLKLSQDYDNSSQK